jgi:hypothetical protein
VRRATSIPAATPSSRVTMTARAFTPEGIELSVVMSPVPTSSESAYLTSGSAMASSI